MVDVQIGKPELTPYRNKTSHGKKNGVAMVHPEAIQGNAEMFNLQRASFTVLKHHFFSQNSKGRT